MLSLHSSLCQSEVSIEVTWQLLTNKRRVFHSSLVGSDCWGNPLALSLVQGVVNDAAVLQLCLAGVAIGPGQGVLPPVLLHGELGLSGERLGVVKLVHPVLEVLSGVRSSALLPGLSSLNDLLGVHHTVLQLKRLHKIAVPDHSSV